MKRPVIIGLSPYIQDYYRKSAETLFQETGGNTGNLAFLYAVASHFPGASYLPLWAPVEHIQAAGDILLLPLANQLGSHTNLLDVANRLEVIGRPVIGIGLGAQAKTSTENVVLTEGTAKWLATLARLAPADAPNIGVRGPYTAEQIGRYGHAAAVAVSGCPSNFINTQDDIAASVAAGFQRKPGRIAVAAGIPHLPELAGIERNLVDIVTLTGGSYIVQHDLQMLQLARNEFDRLDPTAFSRCHEYMMPMASADEFKAWCRRYATAFYDVRAWMDALLGFDFVIGTRFHGVMLAIQAGVPAACIAHDSRTQEMCETMGIPVRHYRDVTGGLTRHNILDYFNFDEKTYRSKRSALRDAYLGMIRAADLPIPRHLATT